MKAMRVLKKILFTFVLVTGMSFAVSAQKDDQKKPPPKPPPPVINPGEGKKPPKNDDKPKKPTFMLFATKVEFDRESA